jgi:CheY-like chemotaxis protein
MKQGKILVVDDEYGIRTGVRQILEMEGFTVTEAETGREALLRHKALKEEALLGGSEQGLIRQPMDSVLAAEKRSDRPGRDDGPRPPQGATSSPRRRRPLWGSLRSLPVGEDMPLLIV